MKEIRGVRAMESGFASTMVRNRVRLSIECLYSCICTWLDATRAPTEQVTEVCADKVRILRTHVKEKAYMLRNM